MRRLGLDFDNTIACYDTSFHQVAVERGWLEPQEQRSKRQVKEQVLLRHGNEVWTELQGLVYGSHIHLAEPFEGVLDFVAGAREQGWEVIVVSHKTRYPVVGVAHDLHRAARDWLRLRGFFEAGVAAVYFEPTRELKVRRVAELGCEIFVDDLAEVFLDPGFPSGTRCWLHFAGEAPDGPWRGFADWRVAFGWLAGPNQG